MATAKRDLGIPGMYPMREHMSVESLARLHNARREAVRRTVTRPVFGSNAYQVRRKA